jgi:hypothetical protein
MQLHTHTGGYISTSSCIRTRPAICTVPTTPRLSEAAFTNSKVSSGRACNFARRAPTVLHGPFCSKTSSATRVISSHTTHFGNTSCDPGFRCEKLGKPSRVKFSKRTPGGIRQERSFSTSSISSAAIPVHVRVFAIMVPLGRSYLLRYSVS